MLTEFVLQRRSDEISEVVRCKDLLYGIALEIPLNTQILWSFVV